jgi:NAD(P)-dependent dehydrogenase (short-subunit alcohol dehydrogenase family)
VGTTTDRMAGRRAFVSGGASGLGAETSRLFAAEGAAIAIADLPQAEDRAGELIAELEAGGGRAVFVPLDVRDLDQVQAAVDSAVESLGGLDTVVASAGVAAHPEHHGGHGSILDLDPAHFNFVMDINLRGVFLVTQRVARHMVGTGQHGAMVTLASMASKRPSAGAYSVSKAAVWMLTRCLAQELGPHGIRVNAIGPGYVDTDLLREMARAGAGDDPEAQAQFLDSRRAQIALGEFPLPSDVAQTALFLCSDAGRTFTGSILHPDGGYTSAYGGG